MITPTIIISVSKQHTNIQWNQGEEFRYFRSFFYCYDFFHYCDAFSIFSWISTKCKYEYGSSYCGKWNIALPDPSTPAFEDAFPNFSDPLWNFLKFRAEDLFCSSIFSTVKLFQFQLYGCGEPGSEKDVWYGILEFHLISREKHRLPFLFE